MFSSCFQGALLLFQASRQDLQVFWLHALLSVFEPGSLDVFQMLNK